MRAGIVQKDAKPETGVILGQDCTFEAWPVRSVPKRQDTISGVPRKWKNTVSPKDFAKQLRLILVQFGSLCDEFWP